jgi:hypothetical protein
VIVSMYMPSRRFAAVFVHEMVPGPRPDGVVIVSHELLPCVTVHSVVPFGSPGIVSWTLDVFVTVLPEMSVSRGAGLSVSPLLSMNSVSITRAGESIAPGDVTEIVST